MQNLDFFKGFNVIDTVSLFLYKYISYISIHDPLSFIFWSFYKILIVFMYVLLLG